mmetsp:Transcript_43234/g.41588  ORF Transcript_43234/g.41588 Transcript_43234/m.41588 type:complete len:99 (-) Transcript_43234:1677-1973(-)
MEKEEVKAISYKTAYTLVSSNTREIVKVNSLKLICFKIANHKSKLIQILKSHEVEEGKEGEENEEKNEEGKRVIKLGELDTILDEIGECLGIVICKND